MSVKSVKKVGPMANGHVYLLEKVDLSFWRSSLFPTRWQIAQFFAQLNWTDNVIRTLTIVYGLIGGRLSLLCCSFEYIVCFEWCVHLIYVTMTAWIKFFWYSFWYCSWWRWWLLLLLLLWRLNLCTNQKSVFRSQSSKNLMHIGLLCNSLRSLPQQHAQVHRHSLFF